MVGLCLREVPAVPEGRASPPAPASCPGTGPYPRRTPSASPTTIHNSVRVEQEWGTKKTFDLFVRYQDLESTVKKQAVRLSRKGERSDFQLFKVSFN